MAPEFVEVSLRRSRLDSHPSWVDRRPEFLHQCVRQHHEPTASFFKKMTALTCITVQAYHSDSMKPLQAVLAFVLVVLFVALSFNAYACLVPIDVIGGTMGSDCPSSQEEPVRQFCDTFKSSAVQSSTESQPALDCQTFCSEDTASLFSLVSVHARHILSYEHSADRPPQDLLLKTTVRRI
ncbi:MAG: hypothetical protein KGO52_14195 [Nitrospirota bacterium]|nr:hypothetical protein [Nitrospirota bacterium]